MRKRNPQFALVLALTILSAACIHKTGGQVTPWERVHTYNAALAEANNALEKGAEAVALSKLASVNEVAPVINCTGQIALLHQQVTSILEQGQVTQANVASVKQLVDVIKGSIATLPLSALGLKNPKTQQTFQADVANIGALADALLASVVAVGGGS